MCLCQKSILLFHYHTRNLKNDFKTFPIQFQRQFCKALIEYYVSLKIVQKKSQFGFHVLDARVLNCLVNHCDWNPLSNNISGPIKHIEGKGIDQYSRWKLILQSFDCVQFCWWSSYQIQLDCHYFYWYDSKELLLGTGEVSALPFLFALIVPLYFIICVVFNAFPCFVFCQILFNPLVHFVKTG